MPVTIHLSPKQPDPPPMITVSGPAGEPFAEIATLLKDKIVSSMASNAVSIPVESGVITAASTTIGPIPAPALKPAFDDLFDAKIKQVYEMPGLMILPHQVLDGHVHKYPVNAEGLVFDIPNLVVVVKHQYNGTESALTLKEFKKLLAKVPDFP